MIICGLGVPWGKLDLGDLWCKVELGKMAGR
jgi:hypothetical protein